MNERSIVAGTQLDLIDYAETFRRIDEWRQTGHRGYIVLTNPHSIVEGRRDARMRRATEAADLVLPDGVGVILGATLLGQRHCGRVTGPRLMLDTMQRGVAKEYTHVLWGGAEGVAQRLAAKLRARVPGLRIAGAVTPSFRDDDEREAGEIDEINRFGADIVWIGLGAPKQEKLMAAWNGKINATAMVGVGAAFDFHSGTKPWAPNWVRAAGLEWSFRLLCEPKRMWRRNLDSPMFLLRVFHQLLTSRHEPRIVPTLPEGDEGVFMSIGSPAALGSIDGPRG